MGTPNCWRLFLFGMAGGGVVLLRCSRTIAIEMWKEPAKTISRGLRSILGLLLAPITWAWAVRLARKTFDTTFGLYRITHKLPENCSVYNTPPGPCWFLIGPWNDGQTLLRPSHLVIVSMLTGKILYNGSAFDEG